MLLPPASGSHQRCRVCGSQLGRETATYALSAHAVHHFFRLLLLAAAAAAAASGAHGCPPSVLSLGVHAAQEAALEANEWDREVPLALQQVHKRVTDFDDEECDQIFLRQVTDKIADNYSDVIKQPMWLQQIGCAPHQRWL